MSDYTIEDSPAEGILRVFSSCEGFQIWTLSNQPVRKDHKCAMCNRPIAKGRDKAYRPITNLNNRMDRICITCADNSQTV